MNMNPWTDLQARLATNGAEAVRSDLVARMAALESQLRGLMAHQPQTKEAFARLTILARASETAQKVVADTGWAESPAHAQTIHS
jgi:hypothetical protein